MEFEQWDPMRSAASYCFGFHVARAVAESKDCERRRLAWFAHAVSVRLGGFDRVAEAIVKLAPAVIGTATMRRLEAQGHAGKLDRQDALEIFHELNPRFEVDAACRSLSTSDPDVETPLESDIPQTLAAARRKCVAYLHSLGPKLRSFCSDYGCAGDWEDPRSGGVVLGSCFSLREILHRLRDAWETRAQSCVAKTVVRDRVWSALDYALIAGPGITLIEGDPRSGKTASTEAYVDAHLDRFRYLTLESTMTDSAFFGDVNRALGNPKGSQAIQKRLRAYIREVMDTRDLALIIDEAHWLWGNSRRCVPNKINWIMTGLVNRGCSVVLIVTPQFMADMGRFEKETQWAAEQWKGRIVNYVRLPSRIADDEIAAVARTLFPEGDGVAIAALAALAKASPSYLGAIRPAVTRARYLAQQAGESLATKHVIEAVGAQGGLIADLSAASRSQDGQKKDPRSRSAVVAPTAAHARGPESISPRPGNRLQGHESGLEPPFKSRSSEPLRVG